MFLPSFYIYCVFSYLVFRWTYKHLLHTSTISTARTSCTCTASLTIMLVASLPYSLRASSQCSCTPRISRHGACTFARSPLKRANVHHICCMSYRAPAGRISGWMLTMCEQKDPATKTPFIILPRPTPVVKTPTMGGVIVPPAAKDLLRLLDYPTTVCIGLTC